MSDTDVQWRHAGISRVKNRRIRIPDEIFREAGIVSVGSPVHWSYEAVVKTLILSNRALEGDEYVTTDFNKLGDESDNFRCTIPAEFFEEGEVQGGPDVSASVPEDARVENGERRHFMYSTDMAQGEILSCYLLTDQEFSDRFENSDWDGNLDQVPKFL